MGPYATLTNGSAQNIGSVVRQPLQIHLWNGSSPGPGSSYEHAVYNATNRQPLINISNWFTLRDGHYSHGNPQSALQFSRRLNPLSPVFPIGTGRYDPVRLYREHTTPPLISVDFVTYTTMYCCNCVRNKRSRGFYCSRCKLNYCGECVEQCDATHKEKLTEVRSRGGVLIQNILRFVHYFRSNFSDFCPKTKPVSGTLSGFKHAILKRLYYLKLKEQSFIGERWEMVALHTERHILFRMKDLINTFGKTLKVLETDATLQLSTLEDVKNSCIFELLLTLQGVQTSSIFKSLLLAFMLCFHKYNMIEFYDRYLRYELKVVFNPPVGVNIYTPTNRRIQVEGSMNALVRAHTPSSVVLGCRSPVLLSTNILLCDIRIRTAFGLEGSFLHNLNHPWGLCVDKDGKIFIPDRRNNCIKIFDNSGHFLNVLQIKIIEQGVERELTLKKPAGIATDGVRVYISDKDNHRVVIYNLVDEETTILGGVPGNAFGDEIFIGENAEMETGEFDFPWGIAVNREGHILVADSKHHKIHLFDRDHMLINEYIIEPPEADARYGAKIAKPRGVCFTPSGEILVTDFEYHRILKFDNELKLQKSIGYPGQFDRPSGICCDDNGFIVVADSKNQRILIYDSRFEYVNKIDVHPYRCNLPHLHEKDRPTDVAILPDGRLVVVFESHPELSEKLNPRKANIVIFE